MSPTDTKDRNPALRTSSRREVVSGGVAAAGLLGLGITAPSSLAAMPGHTLSSFQDQPITGGTVIFNGGSNLSGLDPHITGAVVSWYFLDNIFDRLMRLNPETQEPEPSLAEAVDVSDDGLTYTFTLRQGVQFHNGREMTSDDVKQSFERIQDPDVPAVAKGYFAALDSIETPDPQTVVMNYTEPYPPLLTALTRLETAIVPMEEVENAEEWEVHPVGSGPFRFESYTQGQTGVLSRNDDYWKEGLPYLDGVEQRIIPQPETAVVNVQTGDIHVTGIQASDIATLETDESLTVELLPSTYWAHLSLNTSREPFNNLQVRQALRHAINREDIRELAFFGTGEISNTLIPPGNPYRVEIEGWDFDPERARTLLDETGYGGGFSAVLRISSAFPWQLASAQVIQAYLADLGIAIEIEQIEPTTWFSEVFTDHNYDMSMASHVSKVDPDLSMLDILHSGEFGTKNYTEFSDPEMDEALERGRRETEFEQRLEAYTDAQNIFVERSGYIVLNLQVLPVALINSVQDFSLLSTNELRWEETWLSE